MTMGDAIDGDELDELTDKLSWYESIMRQLQQIFCTELDDPDVTYHEESSKIVERAKRMVEYREMVRDYEVCQMCFLVCTSVRIPSLFSIG
jgi:hypothetical protein